MAPRRPRLPKSSHLARTAYETLRRDIIRCTLMPGARTTSAQLMERYGLSQAPVREALHRLYQEQLVVPIQREGYVIAPITLKQVQDLFGVRLVLEPAVARLAAGRVDVAALRRLVEADEQLYAQRGPASIEAYVQTNTAFHMAIAAACGNERIAAVIRTLLDEMERVMRLTYTLGGWPSYGPQQHVVLMDALAAADGDRAARLMEDQLHAVRKFVIETLISSPTLQTVNLGAAPRKSL